MIGLMPFLIRRGMSLETLVIKGSEVIRRMSLGVRTNLLCVLGPVT